MGSELQVVSGVGKSISEKLKENGIDSIEKLAFAKPEDLMKISGIGESTAKKYIQYARKHLKNMNRLDVLKAKLDGFLENSKFEEDMNGLNSQIDPKEDPTKNNISNKIQKPTDLIMLKTPVVKPLDSNINQQSLEPSSSMKTEIKSAGTTVEPEKPKRPVSKITIVKESKSGIIEKPTEQEIVKKSVPKKNPVSKTKISSGKSQVSKKNSSQRKVTSKTEMSKTRPSKTRPSANRTTYKKKPVSKTPKILKTFFTEEKMQRIRFLHHKIINLDESVHKHNDKIEFKDLDVFYEYIKLLNVNYKTQSQIKIIKDLNIAPTFFDPSENREIQIWDLMYECAKSLWLLASIYDQMSKYFEEKKKLRRAIVSMVECSKAYKTAAYFSAACTRQEDIGVVLAAENLELKSEEARILAQNLAAGREEMKGNLALASKLYAGLSALTKRYYFLKTFDRVKERQLKAQYNYDMGKSCHLLAKFIIETSNEFENEEKIENLQKKANYYFTKAEVIWEQMVKKFEELTLAEKDNIRINLSIINEEIMENDVEAIKDKQANKLQDPEPLVIIPENLAPFIPRTTTVMTKYRPREMNFEAQNKYKNLITEIMYDFNKIEILKNKKSSLGRTIKQLKTLYDNNDIDINIFTNLFEKYAQKQDALEMAISKLKKLESKENVKKKQLRTTKAFNHN